MKPNRSNPLFARLFSAGFASLIVVSGSAAEIAYRTAATSTAEATTAANWGNALGAVPGPADLAAWTTVGFNGESRGGTITFAAPVSWLGLRAEDASGALNFTGSPITLGASGITEVRWELLTINNNVVLGADQSWNISGQTTTVAGSISGAFNLTKSGAAALNLTGDNSAYTNTLSTGAGTLNVGTLGGNLTVTGGTANVTGAIGGNLTSTTGTTTVTGAIGGTVTVNSGTTTLSNTVSGVTTLNGGTLNLNSGGSISDPVINGGTLTGNSGSTITGNVTTLAIATVNLSGGVTGGVTLGASDVLGLRGGSIGTDLTLVSDTLNYTSGVAVTGSIAVTGTQTVNLVSYPAFGVPTTILSHTGSLTDTDDADPTNNFVLGSGSYRSAGFTDTGSALQITLNAGATRTWAGATGSPTLWDLNTTANWTEDDGLFLNGDDVIFDDTATPATPVTVAMQALLVPSLVTFNNAAKAYTLTGAAGMGISGPTGITKNGTGDVTLGGIGSNFTGPVAINAGTLNLGNGEALGNTSGITIAAGARINLNGHAPSNQGRHYSYTIAGDGGDGVGGVGAITTTGGDIYATASIRDLSLSANAEIGGNNGRFDIGNSGGNIGTITGGGFTLSKVGSNQIVVRAPASAVSYTVNAGTLSFEDYDTASGTNPITVNGTAKLGSYGVRTFANNVSLNAGTTLLNIGGGKSTWNGTITAAGTNTFQADNELVIGGTVNASGTNTTAGTNQLTITGTFNNGTVLNQNAGTIQVGNLTAAGSFSGGTVNIGAGLLFRNRLSGANNTINSNFSFANAASTLRQHAGLVGDTLTLSGTIGTLTTTGILEATFGRIALASGANATVNKVSIQGNPVTSQGVVEVKTGASLTSQNFDIGNQGTNSGILSITGGAVTVATGGFGTRIGHWGNGNAVSGSQLNVAAGTYDGSALNVVTSVGWDGYGTMTVGGGANPALAKTYQLQLDNNGDNATYNDTCTLSTNGTLEVGAGGTAGASALDKLILSGGTITGTASSTWGALTDAAAVSTLSANPGVNVTLSGQLTGSADLVKTGGGGVKLSNATNTYTGTIDTQAGTTEIAAAFTTAAALKASGAGTLFLGSTTTSNLSATAGGTIRPGTPSAVGSAIATSLDLNGGTGTFRVGTGTDLLTVPTFTVTSASSISVIPGNAIIAPATFTVLDYTGTIGGLGVAGLTFASSNPHLSGTLTDDTVNTLLKVTITAADSVIWKGNVNGNWDLNSTSNWLLGSDGVTSSKFYGYDVVTLNDVGLATSSLTLVGTISPATVAVENTTGTYTLQGSGFTGGSSLTKTNAGALTLLNDNTNTGLVTISGGTVNVGNGGTVGSLGGSGDIALSGATLAFNRSDNTSLGRIATGTGTLRKQGAGTLSITNGAGTILPTNLLVDGGTLQISTGSFAGDRMTGAGVVTVNSGILLLSSAHSLGGSNLGMNETVNINNGGTLTINGEQYITTLNLSGATINGTNEIRVPASATYAVTGSVPSTIATTVNQGFSNATWNVADVTGSAAADLTISGAMTNGFGPIKSGAGTMVLTGANTYTGVTTVNTGTLQIGAGSTTGVLGIGAVTNNATLTLNRSDALAVANVISGTGAVIQAGAGTSTLSGVNTYTGNTTVNAGTLSLADNAQLKFVIGANGVNNKITGSGTLDLQGDFNLDLTGANTTTGNSWSLVDVGTLTETFTSTFTLVGFTEVANVHTMVVGPATWTFTEATGLLTVSSGTAFDTWANSWTGPSLSDKTAGGDPDGDGISNLMEYILGGDPRVSSSSIMPTQAVVGSNLVLSYKRNDASETDTIQVGQWSTNLSTWTDVTPVLVNENLLLPDDMTVTVPTSNAVAGKLFIRLKATN